MANNNNPWCVLGDFNSIISASKKYSLRPSRLNLKFQQLVLSSGLQDMSFSSNKLTWSNNRKTSGYVAARLDKALCNQLWLFISNDPLLTHLPKFSSDHCPLFLSHIRRPLAPLAPFKFEMWIHHPDFLSLVADSWNQDSVGNHQQALAMNLRNLKLVLKGWNKYVFGDIKLQKSLSLRLKISLMLAQPLLYTSL